MFSLLRMGVYNVLDPVAGSCNFLSGAEIQACRFWAPIFVTLFDKQDFTSVRLKKNQYSLPYSMEIYISMLVVSLHEKHKNSRNIFEEQDIEVKQDIELSANFG